MVDVTARIEPSRAPLSAEALRRQLVRPGGMMSSLDVLPDCPSTNAVVRLRADELGDLAVIATDHQTAGVGRLSRAWVTPPCTALTWSVLLRPVGADQRAWGWLPLLTGLALTDVLRGCGLDAALKWPNDVLVADPELGMAKAAGILCEALPGGPTGSAAAMVIGVGVNVCQRRDELPQPQPAQPQSATDQPASNALPATSLTLAGAANVGRGVLLTSMIRRLAGLVTHWRERAGDVRAGNSQVGDTSAPGLADQVRARTRTLGRDVVVHLPGGATLSGRATAIDDEARLVVATREGISRTISAGDVVHLRSAR